MDGMAIYKGAATTLVLIGGIVGYCTGYGYAHYNLSPDHNEIRKRIMLQLKNEIQENCRKQYTHVMEYTDNNLDDAKYKNLKESRFISTSYLYMCPKKEISLIGDTFILKMFKNEGWLIPQNDYRDMEKKWKETIDYFPYGKPHLFDNLVEKSKKDSENLVSEMFKKHVQEISNRVKEEVN